MIDYALNQVIEPTFPGAAESFVGGVASTSISSPS